PSQSPGLSATPPGVMTQPTFNAPTSPPQIGSQSSPTADEWAMSDTERGQYLSLFGSADADQDGFVGGREANVFFKVNIATHNNHRFAQLMYTRSNGTYCVDVCFV